ncbi:TetR family transcriptional regulator [Streptomyces sp. SID13031]|uniref:TetR family transcriptional regulator n=1 Tax=Streptomyces sp. SID13031 TaxID=2706046 RepID=UPI0013C9632A|nr:TetR family transcriptional regulator [Streptomyces sp. SID13031]NEA31631.1 helix-turn-helix transcriptional regulator [Streptomyces sp. SID13031]
MVYDSAATRTRLLDAAYTEFSERGLAGARVERIAAVAAANKQAIYAYFGSKDGLFDAMLAVRLGALADAAPFTPDDLPAYAGALFDALKESPEILRLTQWSSLERADVSAGEVESHREKAREIAAVSGGTLSDARAMDILMLVIGLSTAWFTTAAELRAIGSDDPERRARTHRAAVVAAAAAVVDALTTD